MNNKITEQNRWIKGKGYHKYCFTTKDIAEITGKAIGTIRNDISKNKLDMTDLKSIVCYISKDEEN